jgi:hypothetical protein
MDIVHLLLSHGDTDPNPVDRNGDSIFDHLKYNPDLRKTSVKSSKWCRRFQAWINTHRNRNGPRFPLLTENGVKLVHL